jgi:ipoprotein LpqH
VVMTDANPPTVDSLALVVDGNALSVSNMGAKVGSANVAVDGKTYTISGQAQGADMKNPMAGMVTKDFNIKVTCG